MRRWRVADVAATQELGRDLAAELSPDGVLLLDGPLGAGKTVLVRGLASGLGIAEGEIQSPTFSLIREHTGSRTALVHIDLYRLDSEDLPAIGLEEILAGPGVKAVEWAERLDFRVAGALRLEIRRLTGSAGREILERANRA